MVAAEGRTSADSGAQPAALVWFRHDLRLADHEPLYRAARDLQRAEAPLLLPFYCLDERELQPRAGEALADGGLGLPQLGPHRLRLLLEACASLRAALRRLSSDLLWAQGRPEALAGRLVALAAAAGASHVALHHYAQPGGGSAAVEAAVAAAFRAAADAAGLPSSVHSWWGCSLYHPDDLPFHLWPPTHDNGGPGSSGGPARGQGAGWGSAVDVGQARFGGLPSVMTDFRKAVQAHAPVRPPLPAPRAASGWSGGDGGGGSLALPPLPAGVAAAAAEHGLLAPLPGELAGVYAAAGGGALAALDRWQALTRVRCAELQPPCSGRHDARSAVPFSMGEEEAVRRLRYYLGLQDSDGHSVRGEGQAVPLQTYQATRMQPFGVDTSAKLSAFLALGCLSPRTVYAEVMRLAALQEQRQQQAPGPADGAASGGAAGEAGAWREPQAGDTWRWLVMHLAIRDFFIFASLKQGDALEQPEGVPGTQAEWRQDAELFRRWAQGQTGLPFVDASMRELAATGYMSNRGRQNVASLLAKALRLDWRWGMRYFESVLGDHEWSLNAGNWSYNAGTGADPRDRQFKTVSQGLRYDPEARLILAWVPELAMLHPAELAHQPWAAPPEALAAAGVRLGAEADAAAGGAAADAAAGGAASYPLPIVDPASQTGKGPRQRQQHQQTDAARRR